MKFKIDENLPAKYSEELQSAGHDAQTVRAESLTGSNDSVLFDHCKGEGRILITLDLEFGNVQSYPATLTHWNRRASPGEPRQENAAFAVAEVVQSAHCEASGRTTLGG